MKRSCRTAFTAESNSDTFISAIFLSNLLVLILRVCEMFNAEYSASVDKIGNINQLFLTFVVNGTIRIDSRLNTFTTRAGLSKFRFLPFASTPMLYPRLTHQISIGLGVNVLIDNISEAFNRVHSKSLKNCLANSIVVEGYYAVKTL